MRLRGLSGARDELVSLAGRDLAADITFDDADARSGSMNYLRTAILLAGLTALFMAVRLSDWRRHWYDDCSCHRRCD
jgi:hypothetical protein